ncbi:cytochrome c biogenesis CcdA family protein [Actinomadura viridis]|uniref:Cytochrome c biogenesis protein CcdA n=1 Tax=Actinomadura viridis TaxID=58110 RepID=A0A931GNJ1_9ACTN|nr:cytochrome c biogenesis CcdA family protein [Actinomadura viridis]MBG6093020.1 cytochrome c biogenesis protein CcdA [Actinomadura viridis]
MSVGYLAAFLGGLLTLVSPCSALLLPAFFAYSFTGRTRLVGRTVIFYLGLCLTLVPLGAAGAVAGRLLNGHRELLIGVGGWTIIALGAAQILGLGFGSSRLRRLAGRRGDAGSALSVGLLGAVYGLSGFCAGPLLGGVLTVSAVGGDPVYGAALLAVYALGMAVPLFVLALLWDRFDLGHRRWLRGRPITLGRFGTHSTSLAGGVFFIVLGATFLIFDGAAALPGLLDPDAEFAAEEWALGLSGAVPDAWILGGAAIAAAATGAVLLLRGLRASRGAPAGGARAEASTPETSPRDHRRESTTADR